MIDIAVMLLPHPDSPTRPSVSPWSILSDTPSTARTSDLRCRLCVRRSLISSTGVANRGSSLSASGRSWVAPEYRCGCGALRRLARRTGRDREHPVALLGFQALDVVAMGRQPRRERVRSQVALNYQVGAGAGRQPGKPAKEQLMQRHLADPDRGVRVNGCEQHLGGHLVRGGSDHVGGLGGGGVGARQLESPFVDIDSPNLGGGRASRQSDGDRAVAAAEVQKVALGRWEGRLLEQRPCPEVDRPRAEDAPIGLKLERKIAYVQAQRARLRGGFGHGIEVVTRLGGC